MIDVSEEIRFKTARSGGSGGQNVNKVETMVEGYFDFHQSNTLTWEQKYNISHRLKSKITKQGLLLVKSQEDRTQLGNKEIVIKKINSLINAAIIVPKKRKPTKVSKFIKEKRVASKKLTGLLKSSRKKVGWNRFE